MKTLLRTLTPLRKVFEPRQCISAAAKMICDSRGLCAEGRVGGCLWRDGFRLDDAIRPPFVTPALAEALLRAGKSLNFLRECCGDTAFEQSLAASPLAAAAAQLSYGKVRASSYVGLGLSLTRRALF